MYNGDKRCDYSVNIDKDGFVESIVIMTERNCPYVLNWVESIPLLIHRIMYVEKLYEKFEKEGKARKTVKAQDLWFEILESQIETGNPYILFKDAANKKSNQKNLGTIKSSNLCTEIIEYTSPDEVAVCNFYRLF